MHTEPVGEQVAVANKIENVKKYRRLMKAHVERMEDNKLPKGAIRYRPQGKKDDLNEGGQIISDTLNSPLHSLNLDSTEREVFLFMYPCRRL
jgi:hypothetical protein